jgi:hypothetical protein
MHQYQFKIGDWAPVGLGTQITAPYHFVPLHFVTFISSLTHDHTPSPASSLAALNLHGTLKWEGDEMNMTKCNGTKWVSTLRDRIT